jgi:hypothetical protein
MNLRLYCIAVFIMIFGHYRKYGSVAQNAEKTTCIAITSMIQGEWSVMEKLDGRVTP